MIAGDVHRPPCSLFLLLLFLLRLSLFLTIRTPFFLVFFVVVVIGRFEDQLNPA